MHEGIGPQGDVRLGRRELQIMNVVWDLGSATVQDVVTRLERPAAYSTILTMMRTLEAKGALVHRMSGRAFVYEPRIAREQVERSVLGEVCRSLFGGSAAQLVNSLLSHSSMSRRDIDELRRTLDHAVAQEHRFESRPRDSQVD